MPTLLHALRKTTSKAEPAVKDLADLLTTVLTFSTDREYEAEDLEVTATTEIGEIQRRLLADLSNDFEAIHLDREVVSSLLKELPHRQAVKFIGKPGVGKSTAMRQVVRAYRKTKIIPVLINLKKHEELFRGAAGHQSKPNDAMAEEIANRLESLVLDEFKRHVAGRLGELPPTHEEIIDYLARRETVVSSRSQMRDLLSVLKQNGFDAFFLVDNVDQLSIPVQMCISNCCLQLSYALGRSVVFTIRDVNVKRHTVTNHGADMLRVVDYSDEEGARTQHLLLSRDELEQLIAKRIIFLLRNKYVARYLSVKFRLDKNAIETLLVRLIRVSHNVVLQLIKQCGLLNASNDNARVALQMTSKVWVRLLTDPSMDPRYNYLSRYLLGDHRMGQSTHTEDEMLNLVTTALTDRTRSLLYRVFVSPHVLPKETCHFVNIYKRRPSARFMLPMAVCKYVRSVIGYDYDKGLPMKDIRAFFLSFGIKAELIDQTVEYLSNWKDSHSMGLLWVDREVKNAGAMVYGNPSLNFFVEFCGVSLEYAFWSIMCDEWSEREGEALLRLCGMSSVDYDSIADKALLVGNAVKSRYASESNDDVDALQRDNLAARYAVSCWHMLDSGETVEYEPMLEHVLQNILKVLESVNGADQAMTAIENAIKLVHARIQP